MKDNPEITKSNILISAKAEFLDKGFVNASLRSIAANANVTTGALYRHFRDKDALFCALVDEVIEKTEEVINTAGKKSHENIVDPFGEEHQHLEDECTRMYIQYVIQNFDVFTLLLTKAGGSTHENFLRDMSDLYSDRCIELVHWLREKKVIKENVDDLSVHAIASNFIFSFAEIVRHKMSIEEIQIFLENIQRFFRYGWLHLFGLTCSVSGDCSDSHEQK